MRWTKKWGAAQTKTISSRRSLSEEGNESNLNKAIRFRPGPDSRGRPMGDTSRHSLHWIGFPRLRISNSAAATPPNANTTNGFRHLLHLVGM